MAGVVSARFPYREGADEELAAQIADAPAPFWGHVRDALAERAETA